MGMKLMFQKTIYDQGNAKKLTVLNHAAISKQLYCFIILLVLSTNSVQAEKKRYSVEPITSTGQLFAGAPANLSDIRPESVSINDHGAVTFVGIFGSAGRGVVVQEGTDLPKLISTNFIASNRNFGSGSQITNLGYVVARHSFNDLSFIEAWEKDNPGFSEEFAQGGLSNTPANDFRSVASFPSISDAGAVFNHYVAFSAVDKTDSHYYLITRLCSSCAFNKEKIDDSSTPAAFAHPMVASNGKVVLRFGVNDFSPIRLYDFNLANFETIAGGGFGFQKMGLSPGISDSGDAVSFAADRGNGTGIFLSLIDPFIGSRHSYRLAGENSIEPTANKAELGADINNNPRFFAAIDMNSRVGVAHKSLGKPGLEDDSFIIVFKGKPNASSPGCNDETPFAFIPFSIGQGPKHVRPGLCYSDQMGIWAVRAIARKHETQDRLVLDVYTPEPILQLGDKFPFVTGDTNDLALYDPVANAPDLDLTDVPNDHNVRVAFYASATSGEKVIIKASHFRHTVVLDPGHGWRRCDPQKVSKCLNSSSIFGYGGFGRDPVKIGNSSIIEDLLTYDMAMAAKTELIKRGYLSQLTRSELPSLGIFSTGYNSCIEIHRTASCTGDLSARKMIGKGDRKTFVSIHTDGSNTDKTLHGTSAWNYGLNDNTPGDLGSANLRKNLGLLIQDQLACNFAQITNQTCKIDYPLRPINDIAGRRLKADINKGVIKVGTGANKQGILVEVAYHTNTSPGVSQPIPYGLNAEYLSDINILEVFGQNIAAGIDDFLNPKRFVSEGVTTP